MSLEKKYRVALITRYFYPDTRIAAKRILNLYRYLNKYPDLKVEVLTDSLNREAPVRNSFPVDLSRVKYLPTYRTGFEKKMLTEESLFYKLLAKTVFLGRAERALSRVVEAAGGLASYDLFYVTVPPFLPLLELACRLKERFPEKKLILEFRDEFIEGFTAYAEKNRLVHPDHPLKGFYRKILYHLRSRSSQRLEEKALAACDLLVTVCPEMKENFTERFPGLGEKIICVRNGIADDEIEEFARLGEEGLRPDREGLTLLYAGLLFGTHDIRPLLRAVLNLLKAGKVRKGEVRIRLYGDHERHRRDWPRRFKELVEFKGRIPREELFREYFLSDLLVFLVGDWPKSNTVMSGKIFELIESGRPILALLPLEKEGCAKELLEKTDSAYFAGIEDEKAIEELLLRLLRMKREGKSLTKPRAEMDWFHRNYHYRNLCRKLYRECLKPVLAGRRRNRPAWG